MMSLQQYPIHKSIILGLSIIISASIMGLCGYKAVSYLKTSDRYITVKGLVEQVEKSDRGKYELTFRLTNNDTKIINKKLEDQNNTILTFLEKHGFKSNEITFAPPQLTDLHNRDYDSKTASSERYALEQVVDIKSKNVDLIKALSTELKQLLNADIPLIRSTMYFYLDRFNELRPQLIVKATQNAHNVAQQLAQASHSKIGKMRRANQGVICITGSDASPNQDYDSDSGSLMKKIRVVTTVDFYIE